MASSPESSVCIMSAFTLTKHWRCYAFTSRCRRGFMLYLVALKFINIFP